MHPYCQDPCENVKTKTFVLAYITVKRSILFLGILFCLPKSLSLILQLESILNSRGFPVAHMQCVISFPCELHIDLLMKKTCKQTHLPFYIDRYNFMVEKKWLSFFPSQEDYRRCVSINISLKQMEKDKRKRKEQET